MIGLGLRGVAFTCRTTGKNFDHAPNLGNDLARCVSGELMKFNFEKLLAKTSRIGKKRVGDVTLNLPFLSIPVTPRPSRGA